MHRVDSKGSKKEREACKFEGGDTKFLRQKIATIETSKSLQGPFPNRLIYIRLELLFNFVKTFYKQYFLFVSLVHVKKNSRLPTDNEKYRLSEPTRTT